MDSDIIKEITSQDAVISIELTVENKRQLVEAFNGGMCDLKELTELIFGPGFDGRSEQGRVIKKYLAEQGIKARSKFGQTGKTQEIILTEEQKSFIANNAIMKPLQLARVVFNNPKLVFLSAECRAISQYYDTIDKKIINSDVGRDDVVYNPPKTFQQCVARIRKYVQNCPINEDKLTQKNKIDINSLMGFLQNIRFIQTARGYEDLDDRELFEDRFVNYTYDKSDLTPEEVDAYINLAIDVVDYKLLIIKLNHLNELLMGSADIKISMSLAEAIKNTESERNQNLNRQEKLRKSLVGNREKRMEQHRSGYASLNNLVGVWKEEENRVKLIKFAQQKEALLAGEIDNFNEFDDVIALIAGISKEEILHGQF